MLTFWQCIPQDELYHKDELVLQYFCRQIQGHFNLEDKTTIKLKRRWRVSVGSFVHVKRFVWIQFFEGFSNIIFSPLLLTQFFERERSQINNVNLKVEINHKNHMFSQDLLHFPGRKAGGTLHELCTFGGSVPHLRRLPGHGGDGSGDQTHWGWLLFNLFLRVICDFHSVWSLSCAFIILWTSSTLCWLIGSSVLQKHRLLTKNMKVIQCQAIRSGSLCGCWSGFSARKRCCWTCRWSDVRSATIRSSLILINRSHLLCWVLLRCRWQCVHFLWLVRNEFKNIFLWSYLVCRQSCLRLVTLLHAISSLWSATSRPSSNRSWEAETLCGSFSLTVKSCASWLQRAARRWTCSSWRRAWNCCVPPTRGGSEKRKS